MPARDDEYDLILAEYSHHIRLIDILVTLKYLSDDELQQRIDRQLRISRQSVKTLKAYESAAKR